MKVSKPIFSDEPARPRIIITADPELVNANISGNGSD